MSPDAAVAYVRRELARHANPARSQFMTGGYAPSRLTCVGTTVPEMRAIGRTLTRAVKNVSARRVLDIALALARTRIVEARQIGYELVASRADAMQLLTPRVIRVLGAGNDNWASVDGFATRLAGPAWIRGRLTDRDVRGWATSRDKWWRRTALVSTVALNLPSRGGHGDARRTLMICASFVAETDPMLAKALSWALRALVPYDAAAVRRFLQRHDVLPALVRREVGRKLTTGRKTPVFRTRARA